jgi:hypothetical protein
MNRIITNVFARNREIRDSPRESEKNGESAVVVSELFWEVLTSTNWTGRGKSTCGMRRVSIVPESNQAGHQRLLRIAEKPDQIISLCSDLIHNFWPQSYFTEVSYLLTKRQKTDSHLRKVKAVMLWFILLH